MVKQRTQPTEKHSRQYFFANGVTLTYGDIVGFGISDTGNHYIDCENGDKSIVAPGWSGIIIKGITEWTR